MDWKPKTELGREVVEGKIKSIDEIIDRGLKIKEPEIVDMLLPDLGKEIIFMGGSPGKGGGIKRTSTRRTARMHKSGRRFNINACVIVGRPGYIGVGKASGREHVIAIEKATQQAKMNIIPIRRGCGSWECVCGKQHSIPFKIKGKAGSLTVELLPAPKGIGLCIGDEMKKIFRLAGIDDIWSRVFGDSRTRLSYTLAIIDAFRNLNKFKLSEQEEKALNKEELIEDNKAVPEKEETLEEMTQEILAEEILESETGSSETSETSE
ncbi:MAG: 30S ribosomal protein S5 [Candidatus Aenigmarchaeota archaeon]|nr:30S ribosomal protein S5 [Candidatus Aenigmarchaeota archaeon]